jgi:TonB family protein
VLAVGEHLKLSADQIAPSSESDSKRRRDVYDAPERADGIVSPAGDIWSVGITLVAVLTQNVSFSKDDSSIDPDIPTTVPEPFRGIARECLHVDPKRRCSIAGIQARLQPAARSVPVGQPALPPPRTPVRRAPIAGALLVIAVVVTLIVFFSRGKSGPANGPSPAATQQAQPQAATALKPTPAVPEEDVTPKETLPGQGDVVHQALPEISPSARNTISGTIKVTVRVEADPSGKVTSARLKSAGPSRYFAGAALKAAERWQFSPPQVNGQPMPSTWLIQFRFKRSGIQASAKQVTR